MALSRLFCGLFGGGKSPVYTIEDIRSVSVSCGHMDYSHCYSFYLRKADGGWLLDAEYAVDSEHPRRVSEELAVTDEDAKELLSAVRIHDLTDMMRRRKKPDIRLRIADETVYCTSLLFTDGKQITVGVHTGDDLVACFFGLAEKYTDAASE